MNCIRVRLAKIPPALFSVVTFLVICWLTLAPHPLGDDTPKLFPGADKMVHAIMFGGLSIMMLFDWQRRHEWQKTVWGQATLYATSASLVGAIIECLQSYMGLGRGFEWGDIVADTAGAFLFVTFWMIFQKFWIPKSV